MRPNGVASPVIAIFPGVFFLAGLLSGCASAPFAGELEKPAFERDSREPGFAATDEFEPGKLPPEVVVMVARQLVESETPLRAMIQILTSVRQGLLYPEEGIAAQEVIDWYTRQTAIRRAKFIAETLDPSWSPTQYNAFWFEQTQDMIRQEEFTDAQLALQALREPMDPDSMARRESLRGLVLLLQSRIPEAVEALERRQGFPGSHRINHFNFAVAMVRHTRRLEGLALLDELSEMPADNPDDRVIGDRANMALGWIWLKAGKGGTARATFKRVSLQGPYANLALLGLGWSELLPDGEQQKVKFNRRLSCRDIQNAPEDTSLLLFKSYQSCVGKSGASDFVYHRSFAYEPGGSVKRRHEKALLWLGELAGRDASDPAVQEALLAVGYLQSRLGKDAQAIQSYKTAVARYDAEIHRLAGLEKALQTAAARPEEILEDSPGYPAQFAQLRSSHRYARVTAGLRAQRQAATEHRATGDWIAQQLPSGRERQELVDYVRREWTLQSAAIIQNESSLTTELTEQLSAEIRASSERLARYRSEAVLAIARLLDRRSAE